MGHGSVGGGGCCLVRVGPGGLVSRGLGSLYYYSDRWQAIEIRDGSENLIRQVMHCTQYIDGIVGIKLENGDTWIREASPAEPAQ